MISLSIDQKESISQIVCGYKFLDKKHILYSGLSELEAIFEKNANLLLSFVNENPLTVIETVIVALLALGGADREVAEVIHVSPNTIRSYISRIRYKLNANSKSDAIIQSIRQGVIKFIYSP